MRVYFVFVLLLGNFMSGLMGFISVVRVDGGRGREGIRVQRCNNVIVR